jgi:hypothetical protein
MKKTRHTETQIVTVLKKQDAGIKTSDIFREPGISDAILNSRLWHVCVNSDSSTVILDPVFVTSSSSIKALSEMEIREKFKK